MTEVMKRGKGRPSLMPKDLFVKVWQAADNLEEVVDTLFAGTDDRTGRKLYCSMRAATIRRTNPEMDLKSFPKGRKPLISISIEEETQEDLKKVAE